MPCLSLDVHPDGLAEGIQDPLEDRPRFPSPISRPLNFVQGSSVNAVEVKNASSASATS